MNILSNFFKKKSNRKALILNSKGTHFIGGKANSEFQIPELDTSPVVYFGCVFENQSPFDFLNFDLNLICPLFIDIQEPVFFDYSNSNRPQLIRENISSDFSPLYDEILSSTYIEYKKLNFIFDNPSSTKMKIGVHNIDVIPGEIGHCDIPNWIRDENWPNCPITGNKMKFLFQLSEINECVTVDGQEVLDKEYIDSYLNFGHGYLYIFFEPESKIVAYINQS